MKLWEAIKAGKRFRRPGQHWSSSDGSNFYQITFTNDAWIAEDWEVEPDPKPRRFAWIENETGEVKFRTFRNEWIDFPGHERAPWLDEPESK